MVGIRYTGTDGRTTEFRSKSADEAMGRLSGIRGYCKNNADEIARGLAKGWKERHLERISKNRRPMPFCGTPGGEKHSSGDGVVSGMRRVSDLRVENGRLVKTSMKTFVSEDGKTVGIGQKRSEVLGEIGKGTGASERAEISGTAEVVIDTVYDTKTHKLYNRIGSLSVERGKLVIRETAMREITEAVAETVGK